MLEAAKHLLTPSKRSNVPPFMVMDVMAAAALLEAKGARVVHMEVGQPAAPAPATALRAAQAALVHGRIGYTETLGIPSLRSAIARHYADTYELALDPARVVVTTGSSGGFILAFLALFEPGDRVALANPGYPPYRHILSALGCEPVLIETSADTRWALSAKALIAAHRQAPLAGVVVASPANPTGTMMDADALARLIAVAEAEGIRVISDEIYHGLDYAFAAETAANFSERALVINSFSKYFCMTGWRVGWMVVPESLVRAVERLQGNLAISVPTLAQVAAEAAFDGREEMEAVKHGYEENRRILTRRPAEGRARQIPARRRRVLSLRRHFALLRRQPGFRQAHAERGARGGDAGHRFRSGERPATSCAFATPARRRRCMRRWSGSGDGCSAVEHVRSLSGGSEMASQQAPGPHSSWGEVFRVFLRLGLTSFGGPIAHLGYYRTEFVERRKWLDEKTYADLVALSQFLPGPASTKIGIAVGFFRAGYAGALIAWAGFTLPSAIALVLFAYGMGTFGDALGSGWLHGLKVVAVAVVAQAVLGMMRSLAPDRERATVAVIAAAIVLAFPTAWGQIGAIILGVRRRHHRSPCQRSGRSRVAAAEGRAGRPAPSCSRCSSQSCSGCRC